MIRFCDIMAEEAGRAIGFLVSIGIVFVIAMGADVVIRHLLNYYDRRKRRK